MQKPYVLIGDPHVTKKYMLGVPVHRRGEREQSLMEDLRTRLNDVKADMVIMVGDLFEKPTCDLKDLYSVCEMMLDACRRNPSVTYVFQAGNHDISPQQAFKGAFDILKLFHQMLPNLHIITKPTVINRVALFPWEWDRTSLEQLDDLDSGSYDFAIGHWDLVSYDGDHIGHMCPAAELTSRGAKVIETGHWHVPGIYKIDGVEVNCTGSMQPMTHSEDPDSELFVTLTYDEYLSIDPQDYKDKYVRVVVEGDEKVESLEDCLGFKVKRASTDVGLDTVDTSFDGLNIDQLVTKVLDNNQVSSELSSEIKGKLNVNN